MYLTATSGENRIIIGRGDEAFRKAFDDGVILPGYPLTVFERLGEVPSNRGHRDIIGFDSGRGMPLDFLVGFTVLADGNLYHDNFRASHDYSIDPYKDEFTPDYLEGKKWQVIFNYKGDQ